MMAGPARPGCVVVLLAGIFVMDVLVGSTSRLGIGLLGFEEVLLGCSFNGTVARGVMPLEVREMIGGALLGTRVRWSFRGAIGGLLASVSLTGTAGFTGDARDGLDVSSTSGRNKCFILT